MASQEDDNKLESKTNVNNEQESHSMSVYKKYECILRNKSEPFPKKIESLIEIWKNLGQCNQQNFEIAHIVQIMDWAKLHTLNIVLTGKWKMFKADYETSLLTEIEHTQNELIKINIALSQKFQKLADVIKNPWDDPILANLLQNSDASIAEPEIEFFRIETAYLVSVRLKKLCESQCEDLALNLVSAYMNCYNLSKGTSFDLNISKIHILFCYDIHIALLYRFNKMTEIIALIKTLSLEDGLDLIQRFSKKRVKISKVWRNYCEITFLASQVFVTAAVTKPIQESAEVLKKLITAWIDFSIENSMIDKLEISLRRIIQAATAAQHIYLCCDLFHEKFGVKLKTFTIELYIRALTTDMNNLESQKTENEAEKVEETTKRLASSFFNLADILKDTVQVSRECALTSFSLEPTLERLRKLEDLARLSGFKVLDTGQIWECKSHPPASSTDEISWICNLCGKWTGRTKLDCGLTTNFALSEALNAQTLGISSQLCDDLAVVLIGPRYQLFSWFMKWEDLHKLCEMYLNDMESTKNLVTELKFVDIDYSMFATMKKEPVDEMAGIERGYENFLQTEEVIPEEAPCSPRSPNLAVLQHTQLFPVKSKPKTANSLRMFRHNIKKKSQVSPTNQESNNLANCSFRQVTSVNSTESDQRLSTATSVPYSSELYASNLPCTSTQPPVQHEDVVNNFTSTFVECRRQNKRKFEESDSSENGIEVKRSKTSAAHQPLTPEKPPLFHFKPFVLKNKHPIFRPQIELTPIAPPIQHREIVEDSPPLLESLRMPLQEFSKTFKDSPPLLECLRSPLQGFSRIFEDSPPLLESLKASLQGVPRTFEDSPPLLESLRSPLGKFPKTFEDSPPLLESLRMPLQKFPKTFEDSPPLLESLRMPLQKYPKAFEDSPPLLESLRTPLQKCPKNFEDSPPLLESLRMPLQKFPKTFEDSPPLLESLRMPLQEFPKTLEENYVNINRNRLIQESVLSETSSPINYSTQGVEEMRQNINNQPFVIVEESNNHQNNETQPDNTIMKEDKEDNSRSLNHFFCSGDKPKSDESQDSREIENEKPPTQIENKAELEQAKICQEDVAAALVKSNKVEDSPDFEEYAQEIDDGQLKEHLRLLLKGANNKLEGFVQNENSSKNANCCLPPPSKQEEDILIKSDKVNVINYETPVARSTPQLPKSCRSKKKSKLGVDNKSEQIPGIPFKPAPLPKEKKSTKNTARRNSKLINKKQNRQKINNNNNIDVPPHPNENMPMNNNKARVTTEKFKDLYVVCRKLTAKDIRNYIPGYQEPELTKKQTDMLKGFKKHLSFSSSEEDILPTDEPHVFIRIDYKQITRSPKDTYIEPVIHDCQRTGDYSVLPPPPLLIVRSSSSSESSSPCSSPTPTPPRPKKKPPRPPTPRFLNRKMPKKPRKNTRVNKRKCNSRVSQRRFTVKVSEIDKYFQNTAINPRVVLERLELNPRYVRSVLSNVPGLNDYEMIMPNNINHIVNVVQVSGGRQTQNVPVQNTQTSTQITPHIQRIGQPRLDKPENTTETSTSSSAPPASSSTTIKPSTSQPSTLINILSQQIIRPGQSNCVRNRPSPLINILSQQIIRPASAEINKTPNTNSIQAEVVTTPPKVPTTVEQPSSNEVSPFKTITTTAKTNNTSSPASGQQGTILQFICKSTLPKFQQAFGKTVYQSSESGDAATEATTVTTNSADSSSKKTPTKNSSSVNIQPIQGGVIYTRQMPVGQAINILPQGRGQVFRIATTNSDQISLVKDTVIHSKMSALLAAALQGKQKASTAEQQSDGEATNEETARVNVSRSTLVQNARIVKPVLQIPSNVIRTSPQSNSNLSSTTLEQLREFDMVYKQIKERSSTSTPSEANTSDSNENNPQRISVTYLNNQGQKYTQLSPVVVVSSYCNLQPAASPALSVTSQGSSSPCVTPAPAPSSAPKVSSKTSKGKTVKNTTQASKASPIPKPQQKPQEDEHTTQRIFDILAEYAEQLRNSPDLNNKPAPRRRSNPPTNPSQNSKRKKSSSSKKSGQCSSMVSDADIEDHRTVGSEDSSCGVVQISVQEEEQSHIQAITTTESNDSTSGSRQQLILTDAGSNQTRNLIIADSSVGEALKMPNTAVLVPGNYIMPVSMVKGGQQIAVVSGGSKILATVPARSGPNMLLFQSFLNQNRNKAGVPTVKYSTIQPISGISSQSIAGVSGQPPVILPSNSHNLTAVTLGQPITLKKIEEPERVNTELLLTISQPRDNGTSSIESITRPDSTNTITSTVGNIELEETIINSDNSTEKVFHTYQKSIDAAPIATPVIAQTSCVKEDTSEQNRSSNSITLNVENNKSEPSKSLERVQSVLVTACTSNGPMLSQTPPRYRKASDSASINNESPAKEEFLHNGEKQNNNDQKQYQENVAYFQNKTKKPNSNSPRVDREIHQLCLQRKQAAIERELRLQKSLSEECEDLGVDEPSTSDLFPEADILFDSNNSPSFDQSSHDLMKRSAQELKDENKSLLFSDDDNSSSLRTDFLFESVEYQTTGNEYDQNQQLTNGQSSVSNESGSSCEDHTLLRNCPSMSDVTLSSPLSPDPYNDTTPPTLNKYKFKYSNRKKGERHKQAAETWTAEVSSSEDTTGSTELGKSSSHSSESCTNKRSHSASCDDELSDGSYKVVRVAISKSDLLKDEESCEELHCEDDLDCSPSGRGARRSVKKMCSCCNGSQDGGDARKRSSSRSHTPAPHKKAFLNKKR